MSIDQEFIFKKFGDPIKGAEDGIDDTINKTLANIARDAKILAPVDKGQLRNSIMYRGPRGDGGASGDVPVLKARPRKHEGYVGSAVDYAVYQEFGTRRTPPQPFLRPAIALSFGKTRQEVGKAMNEAINKWTKGKVVVTKF